jgi:uncharacterized protein YbjT (DUF2867 family)
MKVLVVGATGLIGASVCARLSTDGHEITALVRPGSKSVPTAVRQVIELDIAAASHTEDWLPKLASIEAVVNCAGVLQDSPRERTRDVHVAGAAALFLACEQLGIRRVIHFSAIGADREQLSAFSETKHQGDRALMARDLDWVILRPSVVLGRPAFGASALLRGLAALPILPLMPNTGELQVVQLEDVAATVSFFLDPSAPSHLEMELVGPQRLAMEQVIALYREWFGWPAARAYRLHAAAGALLYRLGDFAGSLGWRPPMRSTARREIARGAIGDPSRWIETTGAQPRALDAALAAEPATVQERWFARLYFLKPVTFIVLSFFWLATGIVSLTTGYVHGVELMLRTGAGVLSEPAVIAGALADICVGLAIAWRPFARLGLHAAIGLSLFYVAAGTVLLPELWNEPLGPLMKIWPIMVLHFVALAILEER